MKNKPLLCKIVSMSTEADTCRKYVLPKLLEAGWDNDPHSFTEQRTFTDGRIVVSGDKTAKKGFHRINPDRVLSTITHNYARKSLEGRKLCQRKD